MIPWTYSEGSLAVQPVIQLFAETGWWAVSDLDEAFGIGCWLYHETKGQRGWAELLTSFHCFTRDLLLPRLLPRKIAV